MPDPPEITDVAGRMRLSVTRLARHLRRQGESGLSPTLTAALATISRHGPLTLGSLAEREQVTPPTITKVVTRLEADGLVTRTTAAGDRRVAFAAITDRGAELLHETRARKDAWLTARVAELSTTDVARLAAALPIIERLAGTSEQLAR